MVAIDTISCGPCANVLCSQYGCQRQRRVIADYLHPHCSAVIVPQGCICPPTSEQTCMSATCPRRLPRT
jgi:hypothetical protein